MYFTRSPAHSLALPTSQPNVFFELSGVQTIAPRPSPKIWSKVMTSSGNSSRGWWFMKSRTVPSCAALSLPLSPISRPCAR